LLYIFIDQALRKKVKIDKGNERLDCTLMDLFVSIVADTPNAAVFQHEKRMLNQLIKAKSAKTLNIFALVCIAA